MGSTTVQIDSRPIDIVVDGGPRTFVLDQKTVTAIDRHRGAKITPINQPIVTQDKRTQVTVAGTAGVQGAPGAAGETEGATFLATPGETIHSRRMVRIAAGLIYHPSLSVQAHASQVIGLATQAGSGPAQLLVRTGGFQEDPSWTWQPGKLWCDDGGFLTQAPPVTGWILPIGRALSATRIEIDIDSPIIRS